MTDYYYGEIRLLAFPNRIPRNFAACNGQLLPISGNEALYAVIGTTYGGDGRVNFALPDLRGRVPLHVGNRPGSAYNYVIGNTAGSATVTLGQTNLPSHLHTVSVSNQPASSKVPGPGVVQGDVGAGNSLYCAVSQAGVEQTLALDTVSMSTNSVAAPGPHDNMQPTMALVYVICINGLFPSS